MVSSDFFGALWVETMVLAVPLRLLDGTDWLALRSLLRLGLGWDLVVRRMDGSVDLFLFEQRDCLILSYVLWLSRILCKERENCVERLTITDLT